jgi:hypothetical protein
MHCSSSRVASTRNRVPICVADCKKRISAANQARETRGRGQQKHKRKRKRKVYARPSVA